MISYLDWNILKMEEVVTRRYRDGTSRSRFPGKEISPYQGYKEEIFAKGYTVVNVPSIDTVAGIREIVKYLESQPRVPGREIRIPRITNLTKNEVSVMSSNWVPWKTFGAPTEPPVYHLKYAWKARENPHLVSLFKYLLDSDDIRVTIDRVKAKLPGTGEREFCHWDSNPWEWDTTKLDLQGILALTDLEFICVPGTNTEQFRQAFIKAYTGRVDPGTLTQLNPHNDPWGLCRREVAIKLKPGQMIIWDNKLLHSSYPNKTKDMKFAYYITYQRASEVLQPEADRLVSYLTGKSPKFQPSGKRLSYIPAAFARFQAKRYVERLPRDRYETFVNRKGNTNVRILEIPPSDYEPPRLTKLGYQILWGKDHPPTQV